MYYYGYRPLPPLPPMYLPPKMHPRPVSPFDKQVAGEISADVNKARSTIVGEAAAFVKGPPASDRARPLDPKHAPQLVNHSHAPDMQPGA